MSYNFAIAWKWEYDREFVNLIRSKADECRISVLEIKKENINEVIFKIENGEISFDFFLDRASDEDETFLPLSLIILDKFRSGNQKFPYPINARDLIVHAADKATMHLEFLSNGIEVPYTIIISPYNKTNEIELSLSELAKLGRPFIIKPANTTGGGIGVVTGAETLKEVIEARQSNKYDKYLLQETIKPCLLDNKRAWFRVFYAFGEILSCWWDDLTHVYSELTIEDEARFNLFQLRSITERIQKICKLDFFSTELVFTSDGRCVTVDYVNEICDMRFQSSHFDGVPDQVIQKVVDKLVIFIKNNSLNI